MLILLLNDVIAGVDVDVRAVIIVIVVIVDGGGSAVADIAAAVLSSTLTAVTPNACCSMRWEEGRRGGEGKGKGVVRTRKALRRHFSFRA